MPSTSVVISQVCTGGPNGISDEFVELRNISTVEQDIGGWRLGACNTDGTGVLLATMPANTVMQPKGAVGQFFLVANADGYSAATPADRTYSGVEIQDQGGVKLLNTQVPAQQIDAVGFSAGLQCTETCPAVSQSPATYPLSLCCHRNALGVDTDVNCVDCRQLPRNPRNRFS